MKIIKSFLVAAIVAAGFAVRADYLYWMTDGFSGNSSLDVGDSGDYAVLYATTSADTAGTQVGEASYFFGESLGETSIRGETDVSGYSEDTLFYVDIYSDGERVFNGLTQGNVATYASLEKSSFIGPQGQANPSYWNAVPEPTGGVLLLLGAALLGLRRKKAEG